MDLFITLQHHDGMHEEFVMAALLECMRFLPVDLFVVDSLEDFNNAMQAYLMK
jgi:hypothetical protein